MSEFSKFFDLLRYKKQLEAVNKDIRFDDPVAYKIYLGFMIKIEASLHYKRKSEYIKLIVNFLEHKINAFDFSLFFMRLYQSVTDEKKELIDDFHKKTEYDPFFECSTISKLLRESDPLNINETLVVFYSDCNCFNPELAKENDIYITEEQLIASARKTLLELQMNLTD